VNNGGGIAQPRGVAPSRLKWPHGRGASLTRAGKMDIGPAATGFYLTAQKPGRRSRDNAQTIHLGTMA